MNEPKDYKVCAEAQDEDRGFDPSCLRWSIVISLVLWGVIIGGSLLIF